MKEKRTLVEQLANWIFAIPTVAQWWAKRAAKGTESFVDHAADIPFVRLAKPLAEARVALLTSAGVHLRTQTPFDMVNPDGDPSYREIPATADQAQLTITHKYYDHSDADKDVNVVFPLDHFRDLAEKGIIGSLAPRHFGLMGHVDHELVTTLTTQTAPEVATKLRADGVDFAFLTPA